MCRCIGVPSKVNSDCISGSFQFIVVFKIFIEMGAQKPITGLEVLLNKRWKNENEVILLISYLHY